MENQYQQSVLCVTDTPRATFPLEGLQTVKLENQNLMTFYNVARTDITYNRSFERDIDLNYMAKLCKIFVIESILMCEGLDISMSKISNGMFIYTRELDRAPEIFHPGSYRPISSFFDDIVNQAIHCRIIQFHPGNIAYITDLGQEALNLELREYYPLEDQRYNANLSKIREALTFSCLCSPDEIYLYFKVFYPEFLNKSVYGTCTVNNRIHLSANMYRKKLLGLQQASKMAGVSRSKLLSYLGTLKDQKTSISD